MVDIKVGVIVDHLRSFQGIWGQMKFENRPNDTFKPIIAMYFADGAEKPLDNFIETVRNRYYDYFIGFITYGPC